MAARGPFILAAVLYGHFCSAAVALGMPPFYGRILAALGEPRPALVGLIFIIPTLGAALANPLWGRLADRWGKKPALLRAHLGLAAAFFAASLAETAWQFALALAIQGLFGGSFAASNAYLATRWSGPGLARLLTLMQGSARLALCAGPVLVGLGLSWLAPLALYQLLALLPLCAAWLVLRLPEEGGQAATAEADALPAEPPPLSPVAIYAVQYAFVFGTVLGFPYFLAFCATRWPDMSEAMGGLLYGLPHGVYLLAAAPLARALAGRESRAGLQLALALSALGLAGQVLAASLAALCAWRLLLGLGMAAAYVLIHGLVARVTVAANAGRRFGALEAGTKWGAVSAGLGASLLSAWGPPEDAFLLGAAVLALALSSLFLVRASQPHRPPRMPSPAEPKWSER